MMTKGGGGQKSQKINDVFYERPLTNKFIINCNLQKIFRKSLIIVSFTNIPNDAFRLSVLSPFNIVTTTHWNRSPKAF